MRNNAPAMLTTGQKTWWYREFSVALALCISLLLWDSAAAQKFHFDRYSEANGLPQSYVYAVAQDSAGYLWAGTGEGLGRYDGSHMAVFRSADGLAENFVSTLHYQGNGRLWIGHNQGSISLHSDSGFTILRHGNAGTAISCMATGPEGHTWVCTRSDSLFVYDQQLNKRAISLEPLGGLQVQALAHGPNGDLLFGTDEGLVIARLHESQLKIIAQPEALSYIWVGCITRIDDEIWLAGTPDDGIFEVLKTESGYAVGRQFTFGSHGILNGHVRVIAPVGAGRFVAGTTVGFSNFSFSAAKGIHTVQNLTSRNLLMNPNISTITADRDQNYWIGTLGGGLLRFPANKFVLLDTDAGLNDMEVLSVTSGPDRFLWAGTQSGFSKVYRALETDSTEIKNFAFHAVTAIHHDGQSLWLGTEKHGLHRFDPTTGKIAAVDLKTSFAGYPIQDIQSDGEGRLWIATLLGGAYRYNLTTHAVETFNSSSGLLHNDIYQITIDSKKRVWFAMQGSGLTCLNGKRFEYLGRKEGLTFPDISTIYEDRAGMIWVGTPGAGIYRWDGKHFDHWTIADGLLSDFIYSLFSDQSGDLWAVSATGLTRFHPQSGSFSHYSGLAHRFDLHFETALTVEKPAGTFALGTNKGLALFTPTVARPNPVIKTTITYMTVAGVPVNLQDELELPYDLRKRLNIGFDAISLARSEGIVFEYRLLGFDSSWVSTTSNQVDFQSLPDGDYTFEVRARVKGAATVGPVSSYHFHVLTPLWKTWWFVLLGILLVTGSIVLVIQLREGRLRSDKTKLEEAVVERTRKLETQKAQLEQFAYAISHDLKNPVLNISGLLEVVKEGAEQLDQDAAEALDLLETNAHQLQNNLAGMMSIIQARNTAHREREPVQIAPILAEIETSILLMIKGAGATIISDFSACPIVASNPTDLKSILYNLVTNGIKYCRADVPPVVTITSWKAGEFDVISVRDNGLGLDLDKEGEKLFAMFKRIHSHVEGSGVGLHLIKTIIETAGGKIEVESVPGQGTEFRVFLPAGAETIS